MKIIPFSKLNLTYGFKNKERASSAEIGEHDEICENHIDHLRIGHGIIDVRLTPKASSNRIGKTKYTPNGVAELALYVTAPAEKDKANKAMIELLSKHFNISISRISIISGRTSRNKRIKIE